MQWLKSRFKDSAGKKIELKIDSPNLDFAEATGIAKQKAKEICADPMPLSRHPGKTGESHPNVACGPGDKRAWIVMPNQEGAI